MTDLKCLREKIDDSGLTITALADKCGIRRETLYNKLQGTSEFKASEIMSITNALHMSQNERDAIFFAGCVE